MPNRYSTEGAAINEKAAILTLLLFDGMKEARGTYLDQKKIVTTLHDLLPGMSPVLRHRMQLWMNMPAKAPCEITPEASEADVYPTNASKAQTEGQREEDPGRDWRKSPTSQTSKEDLSRSR